jgi:hypothetical protein
MTRILFSLPIWIFLIGIAVAENSTVVVPLNQIWGYDMPDTRDVRELEPDKFGAHVRSLDSDKQLQSYSDSLTSKILESLRLSNGQTPRRAFVVEGTGLTALQNATEVMTGNAKPVKQSNSDTDVSLMFFAYESGFYVQVDRVEIESGRVMVRYHLTPHETKELTRHFALIPLGTFPPGTIRFEFISSPQDTSVGDAFDSVVRGKVCRPFSLEVVKP